jgi:hypothetical protein
MHMLADVCVIWFDWHLRPGTLELPPRLVPVLRVKPTGSTQHRAAEHKAPSKAESKTLTPFNKQTHSHRQAACGRAAVPEGGEVSTQQSSVSSTYTSQPHTPTDRRLVYRPQPKPGPNSQGEEAHEQPGDCEWRPWRRAAGRGRGFVLHENMPEYK